MAMLGAECSECCGGWICDSCGGLYTYGPTAPHYVGGADCPKVACDGTGSCLDAVLEGYLDGPVVSSACLAGKQPKAKIISATLDNSGSIGDAFATYPPPPAWRPCPVDTATISNVTVDAELTEYGEGSFLMRLPFSVTNGPGGGPYGVLRATICFFFEEEETG